MNAGGPLGVGEAASFWGNVEIRSPSRASESSKTFIRCKSMSGAASGTAFAPLLDGGCARSLYFSHFRGDRLFNARRLGQAGLSLGKVNLHLNLHPQSESCHARFGPPPL